MQIGKLRHLVTIQAATETQNALGETELTWADIGQAWAHIEPVRGQEFLAAQQVQQNATVRITLRAEVAISPGHRIVWIDPNNQAHIFDIIFVGPDPTWKRYVTLLCTEDLGP